MLSRTAENLFWMGRYIERAETMGRLMQVGARMNLLPDAVGGYRSEWEAILQATGTMAAFTEKYGEPVERNAISHLFFDYDNPSSVASCLRTARENARIVRTALSGQVWNALNGAYQELRAIERRPRSEFDINEMGEWIANHVALVNGGIGTTQLRSDGFDFINLGINLERADNTARFIDVKYYVLLPDAAYVGTGLDNFQWQTLLRGMQMHRAFHWAYGGEVSPSKIVDLLILNPACPRSLRTALHGTMHHLDHIARAYGTSTAAQSQSRALLGELMELQISDIFDEGLHEFLTRFNGRVAMLGTTIRRAYLLGVAA
ncbi:MAG: alpha-E domain-containing protein [Qingshengfaniella sp.]